MDGICTLANDVVYDQLVALLNSIEANLGAETPVCIYPYDDRLERVLEEVSRRPNVTVYGDRASIDRWETFAKTIWAAHPTAHQQWQRIGSTTEHRLGMHRRFCGFDGPFDRFIYLDADTLVLGSLQPLFDALETHDVAVYDFQFKDPSHVYDVSSPKLNAVFSDERIGSEIFCAGMFAAKRGLFPEETRNALIRDLSAGDAEILYAMAPDQTMLNYMVMKTGLSSINFSRTLPKDQVTGCCVTSPHFVPQGATLLDHGQPLTYLHYIGLSSSLFTKLCSGDNIDFPYRDLFLHYRYLKNPGDRPSYKGKPKPYDQPPSIITKLLKKLTPAR
ncbi:MAG TPA: Npun_R2821/Npun_R2822 family protein [Chroococcidiopsis sp.]